MIHPVRSYRAPRRLVCLLGGVLALGSALRADDDLPVALPATRYDALAAHWPFAPPTVAVVPNQPQPPPPAPAWSDKLTVVSLVQIGATFIATVADQDNPRHLFVSSEKENPENLLKLESVEWGATPDKFVIKIRRGMEVAQVRYDPGTAGSPGPTLPGAGPPGIPGARPVTVPNAAPPLFRPPGPAPAPVGPVQGVPGRRVILSGPQAGNQAPARPGAAVPGSTPFQQNNPAANQAAIDDDDE